MYEEKKQKLKEYQKERYSKEKNFLSIMYYEYYVKKKKL